MGVRRTSPCCVVAHKQCLRQTRRCREYVANKTAVFAHTSVSPATALQTVHVTSRMHTSLRRFVPSGGARRHQNKNTGRTAHCSPRRNHCSPNELDRRAQTTITINLHTQRQYCLCNQARHAHMWRMQMVARATTVVYVITCLRYVTKSESS